MIPYILTNDSLTVIINGKSLTMNRDNPSFRSATQALQDEDYEKVEQMFDIPKAVVNFAQGNVSVKDGVVTYKGEEVHNYCVERSPKMICVCPYDVSLSPLFLADFEMTKRLCQR